MLFSRQNLLQGKNNQLENKALYIKENGNQYQGKVINAQKRYVRTSKNTRVYTDLLVEFKESFDTNYIVSPANIYTRLTIRMDSIFNRIEKRLGNNSTLYSVYVNKADLIVDVLHSENTSDRPRDVWDTPAPHMMLIKEEQLDSFFSKNELPSDTCAIVASLAMQTDSLDNALYSYTYDLSSMLTQQLRSKKNVSELRLALVPVAVTANSSTSTITSIKQMQTISATRIRSANNSINPMDIEMVYCSFNRTR